MTRVLDAITHSINGRTAPVVPASPRFFDSTLQVTPVGRDNFAYSVTYEFKVGTRLQVRGLGAELNSALRTARRALAQELYGEIEDRLIRTLDDAFTLASTGGESGARVWEAINELIDMCRGAER